MGIVTTTTSERTHPRCPHCGVAYDTSGRIEGDIVWHRCGSWFIVRFGPDGVATLTRTAPIRRPR